MHLKRKAARLTATLRKAASQIERMALVRKRATKSPSHETTPKLVQLDSLFKPDKPDWIHTTSHVERPLITPPPRPERWTASRRRPYAPDLCDPYLQSSPYSPTARFYTNVNNNFFYVWKTWPDGDSPFKHSTLVYNEEKCQREHFRLMLEQTEKRMTTSDASGLAVLNFLSSLYHAQLEVLENMDPFWTSLTNSSFAQYLLLSRWFNHSAIRSELHELTMINRALSTDIINLQRIRLLNCLIQYGGRTFAQASKIIRTQLANQEEFTLQDVELKRSRAQIKIESRQRSRYDTAEYAESISNKTRSILDSPFDDESMQLVDDEPHIWPAYSVYRGLHVVVALRLAAMIQLNSTLTLFASQDAVPTTAFRSRKIIWQNLRLLQMKINILTRELRDLNVMLYPLSLLSATSLDLTDANSAELIEKSREYVVTQTRRSVLMREEQLWYQLRRVRALRRKGLHFTQKGRKAPHAQEDGTGRIACEIRKFDHSVEDKRWGETDESAKGARIRKLRQWYKTPGELVLRKENTRRLKNREIGSLAAGRLGTSETRKHDRNEDVAPRKEEKNRVKRWEQVHTIDAWILSRVRQEAKKWGVEQKD